MADLIERLFPDAGQAETALMLIVLLLVAVGVWFGRKRLRVTIPVAGAVFSVAAIAIPSCIPARSYAQRAVCSNNLKLIAEAKLKWAAKTEELPGDVPSESDLFPPDFGAKPTCPVGGTYSYGVVAQMPTCSLEGRGHKLE